MAPAGKQQQQQGQGAVVAAEPGAARRLWRVVRAVLYMLRRGLPSGRKLAMDLSLLLHRGKIAGKALGELFLAFHHGRHGAAFPYAGGAGHGAFSCRALDPSLAVHEPAPRGRREVEFSCSNTPSAGPSRSGGGLGLLGAGKRRRRGTHHDDSASGGYLQHSTYYDAAEVARVFEMLNGDDGDHCYRAFISDDAEPTSAASATPSPAQLLYWAVARSPAVAAAAKGRRAPRATDSPADGAAGVDRQADEFIRRFYEQLRAQRSAASTPDYYGHAAGASPYTTPRARRPVAAGIA
ncbi:uncharacterized protein LOC120655175 [Panicum virgatum]|uniref:Uncharacterized protein n=1 Tax=Panicum virgatum TaxID=38727 RepID=A0A8T0WL06_PANVG|nr:uncharacterized protein LOC120655175 [Panicum virgatum]KAG2649672.1 hypothetical protein PVAP13_1NG124219 [Panicum virgatum]